MPNAMKIASAYIDTWNETDSQRRGALLGVHWATDASCVDPMIQAAGQAQIAGLVGAVHERFPGFRFRLAGTPDGHGQYVRLSWSLGPESAPAPIEGGDVIRLEEGRIREVIAFIDRAPSDA